MSEMRSNYHEAERLIAFAAERADELTTLAQVHALLAIADAIRDTPPKDAAIPDQEARHDPNEDLARALLVTRVAGGDAR